MGRLSKIHVRDSAAVDRGVVSGSDVGVATDALLWVGGRSSTAVSLEVCMNSSRKRRASV
eukprot:8698348-Pyramimonas_sp.AAC.1